jgi:hypothetical protein
MIWTAIQNDWPRFLSVACAALPFLAKDGALAAAPGREAFRDHLARAGDLTPREAEEVIEWRLVPGYCRARFALAAE